MSMERLGMRYRSFDLCILNFKLVLVVSKSFLLLGDVVLKFLRGTFCDQFLHDGHKETRRVEFERFTVFGSALRIGDEIVLSLGVVANQVVDVIVLEFERGHRGFEGLELLWLGRHLNNAEQADLRQDGRHPEQRFCVQVHTYLTELQSSETLTVLLVLLLVFFYHFLCLFGLVVDFAH